MSTSSFKKISAAAIAAVIGLSGMAHAAPIALPYSTNFSTTPDSNGNTYTGGGAALQGQAPGSGAGSLNGSAGWVNELGEQNDIATVTNSATGGTVTLNSVAAGTFSAPVWSDVFNSNLADHPAAGGPGGSGPTGNSNGNGVALNSSTYGGNVTVGFNLDVLGTGSQTTTGGTGAASAFGVRILDSSDNLLAALFVKPSAPTGSPVLYVQSGTDQATDNLAAGSTSLAASGNGSTGSYSIHLDFNNQQFQVFANGVESQNIPFGTGETGVTSIGGISLATDNIGTNTGIFSNFSVVPEPASFAMIGLGGLMLLAKRPKRLA